MFDNPYYTSAAAEASKRLGEQALACLDALDADRAGGKAVTAAELRDEYCFSFKIVELWKRKQIRAFGQVASESPAFIRVCENLKTPAMRAKVVSCAKGGIGLDGPSDDKPGIVECRQIVLEMRKIKAGSDKPPGAIVADPSGQPTSTVKESQAPTQGSSAESVDRAMADDAILNDLVLDTAEAKPDPVAEKARAAAEQARDAIEFYKDFESLFKSFQRCAKPQALHLRD